MATTQTVTVVFTDLVGSTQLSSSLRDVVWTTAMAHYGDSAVNLRNRKAAHLLYDEMRPFSDFVMYPIGPILGAFARPVGRLAHLLGHHQDAESFFRSALSMNERLKAPFWIARTKLDYADLLQERSHRGDVEKATEMTEDALGVAQHYGYGGLVPRAQSPITSLG